MRWLMCSADWIARFPLSSIKSVYSGVVELLTVPWFQGIDPVVSAFGSEWAVLEDGSMKTVHFNNTFSFLWSLYKPFHTRDKPLDFLYIGFKVVEVYSQHAHFDASRQLTLICLHPPIHNKRRAPCSVMGHPPRALMFQRKLGFSLLVTVCSLM